MGDEVKVKFVELSYPRVEGNVTHLEIDLVDVRASDGLRVSYDFDRDGWIIEQPINVDEDTWKEVFFAKSWALEAHNIEYI